MCSVKELFSSPKPIKRNFIQENVRHLRELEKYCQSKRGDEPPQRGPTNSARTSTKQFPNSQRLVASNITSDKSGTKVLHQSELFKLARDSKSAQPTCKSTNLTCKKNPTRQPDQNKVKDTRRLQTRIEGRQPNNTELLKKNDIAKYVQTQHDNIFDQQNVCNRLSNSLLSLDLSSLEPEQRVESQEIVTHRTTGCQTIDPEELDNLYMEGTIRFPSARKQEFAPEVNIGNKNTSYMNNVKYPQKEDYATYPLTTIKSIENKQPLFDLAAQHNSSSQLDQRQVDEKVVEKGKEVNDEVTDFVQLNVKAAASVSKPCLSVIDPLVAPITHRKGVIPKYLQKRKEEWQKENEQKLLDAPDPACPPGHLPLGDAERIETLKMLKKSYVDLVNELNMMPVRTDTLRMRQRKMDLEKQLNKLEDGIKVFSRPKVFVKIGE